MVLVFAGLWVNAFVVYGSVPGSLWATAAVMVDAAFMWCASPWFVHRPLFTVVRQSAMPLGKGLVSLGGVASGID